MDLDASIRTHGRTRRQVVAALDAVSPALRGARPPSGGWSPLEIFEHLVLAEAAVFKCMPDPRLLDGVADGPRSRLKRAIVRAVLGLGIPVAAPSPAMLPSGAADFDDLRRRWEQAFAWIASLPATIPVSGPGTAYFEHPVAGALTLTESVRLNEAHVLHHLAQIRRLLGR